MRNANAKIIKRKVGLLNLAEELGNTPRGNRSFQGVLHAEPNTSYR